MKFLATFLSSAFLLSLTLFLTVEVSAQNKTLLESYRGVTIGMGEAEVREKLGKNDDDFADEDMFELSDTENARVFYSPDKKVKAMVITFSGKLDAAPLPKTVIGEPIEPNADGGMFKMVRFPDKGFWISYSRTSGENPAVMITVQEMRKPAS